MNEGLNYLQTFNPIESKAELLEKTLIGRKDLVDMLETLVIESATSGNKHQRLIIGSRGSGKTHLLRVLYNRVAGKDELKDKLKIAYLCEDEYGIANFLDFIIRIFRAFIKWDPVNSRYLGEEIDRLKKIPPQDQESMAKKILLKHIEGTTLLIIAENIGDIFNAIEVKGQRKLRDLVQQYPNFSIIASNQALFKDIQYEDRPFHNFFKITHLKKLTLEEVILFLKSIAQWEEKTDLLKFLDQPEGRGRIHAIYDITGGNHRLLVTFYNFLKIDYKNDLSYSFIKTINDLIPYYQSFMNLLSAQQQKIIQYLCQNRKPSSVKDIAENCFSAPNTISKQVSTLEKLKYVDAASSGKETFYELSEPLLRICFEVKENRGGPVKLFIDFLGNLYSVQEVKEKYMRFHLLSKIPQEQPTADFYQEQLYYKETIRQYFPQLFQDPKIVEFEKGEKDYQVKTYIEELEKTGAYPEILEFASSIKQKDRYLLLKEASAFGKTGDIKRKIETAKQLLKKNKNDIDALLLLADAYQKNKDFKKSDEKFNCVLKLYENNISALNGLGVNLMLQEKYKEAEQYFLKVLALEPDNYLALGCAGFIAGNQGRNDDAFSYFEKLTKLNPGDSISWSLQGASLEELGRFEEAKASYLKALELDKENADTLERLSILLGNQDNYQQAYHYLKELTTVAPDYSRGWILLGLAQAILNEIEAAKASFLKALELDEKDPWAILGLARIFAREGNFKESQIYIEQALIDNPGDSDILNLIGVIHRETNRFETAIPFCNDAIKADSKNLAPHFGIISSGIGLNDMAKALSQLEQALNLAKEIKLPEPIIQGFEENYTTLFIHGSKENVSTYLRESLLLIERYGYMEQLFKALPQALFNLLIQHEKIESNRFEWIEILLNETFKDTPAMTVALKFLNIGIRHLKKKEKNALFQFTKEERKTFREFVLDRINKVAH